MNAGRINTLGGVCELLGVAAVVWGLVDLASYRGVPARIRAWLDARRAGVAAAWRRLRGRPGRVVSLSGTAAVHSTGTASMQVIRGPFTPRPGQSLENQIAELAALVNRLRDDLVTQEREHRQAIDTLRQQMDGRLQAEQQRADDAVNVVRGDLDRLRETTTGGLRLEIDGVLGVVVGVFFTTWPDDIARWLPSWPPFRVAMFFVLAYVFARVSWAWLKYQEMRAAGQSSAGRD